MVKVTEDILNALIVFAEAEMRVQDTDGYRGSYFTNECRLSAFLELKQRRAEDRACKDSVKDKKISG